ncbi:MAG: hypothetical protein A2W90_00840 [Bacteroidetes bacterium GWF2_42_66]|nr:MAG: hypothetical protein A2W92_02180 [Bacteroidetes bacterium GWA2_42_15]OFX99401.1 MAG: hypothetical protein A2W89_12240 [Bacteroidetes bacterium GWE2_42_39]OFY40453.1 MAG: hypothetical protein A2W90_00840 [Bacteroidetes bacterium GWF2_42_66]HBL76925.1 hypothetical protein [Prolixibacteraceae bacterium]HCR90433.1 hypothetical protein [Prolixibacteraceae bacterium]
MAFKCKIGLHSWNGCKCSECEKTRDEQHDWSADCEKCSKCGKIRENHHNWLKDCEICDTCNKTRENYHIWIKCICSTCGKDKHHWERSICKFCGQDNSKIATDLLFKGAISGDIHEVNQAILAGADLAAIDEQGWPAILQAASSGMIEIVKAILMAGVDINKKYTNKKGEKNLTILHIASYCGHTELVKYLINYGADINAQDDDGSTSLFNAVVRNHFETVKVLLEGGANINLSRKGITPQMYSFSQKYSGINKLLYDYNKKPNNDLIINLPPNKLNETYKTIKIGTQEWMAENLNVSHFRNGDIIIEANTDDEWMKAADDRWPVCCSYQDNPENDKKYGKLYSWYAVSDPRGLAPEGWHIPSDEEWKQLTDFLEVETAGIKMKSIDGWKEDSRGGISTNESGFNGLPIAKCASGPRFGIYGISGAWWSSTSEDTKNAWSRDLISYRKELTRELEWKWHGLSIRCIKD